MLHQPVLLKEILDALLLKPGDEIVDATIDGGGHAQTILQNILPKGRLLGLERDPQMLAFAQEHFRTEIIQGAVTLVRGSYANIQEIAAAHGFYKIRAILFDLGVSSFHFDVAGRGFSFQRDEPLDMRFENNVSGEDRISAERIINTYPPEELARILKVYGEEHYARLIAKAIVSARRRKKIRRTKELVEVIVQSVPQKYRRRRIHPATKTFQALRMEVNQELAHLATGLSGAYQLLENRGRVAVISYHGGEDRLVKQTFRKWCVEHQGRELNRRGIVPSQAEKVKNPRSRSARLRVFEKVRLLL